MAANHLKIIGEAYEKFDDTNTSVSANKEPNSYRAMKRYFLSSEQKNQCKNASISISSNLKKSEYSFLFTTSPSTVLPIGYFFSNISKGFS